MYTNLLIFNIFHYIDGPILLSVIIAKGINYTTLFLIQKIIYIRKIEIENSDEQPCEKLSNFQMCNNFFYLKKCSLTARTV